jgi:cysteine-S-conjugate beta-lyase
MSIDFDSVPNRRQTESAKWLHYDQDILPMWVADMDFRSPEPVIQALRDRVEHGIFGYPEEPPELKQTIIERLLFRYGWKVEPDDIVFLPGVVTGFNVACHAIPNQGAGVLMQTPVYPPILKAPNNSGLIRQEAALSRQNDGRYEIDFDKFEEAITPQTRLFLLCNPHNPVGRVFTRAELLQMAEICQRHGIIICSDEIHCELIFSGHTHISIAALDEQISRQTITLMAPSKTFNIAGLDCSFAVIQDEELRKQYQKARKGLVGGVNLLGLVAALAAYQYGQPWLDELIVYLEENRNFVFDYLKQELPGVTMALPEATYLAWLDCRQLGLQEKPCNFFIDRARVACNDGEEFGPGGEGFVRLNFGCPRSMLQEALDKMKTALLSNGIKKELIR